MPQYPNAHSVMQPYCRHILRSPLSLLSYLSLSHVLKRWAQLLPGPSLQPSDFGAHNLRRVLSLDWALLGIAWAPHMRFIMCMAVGGAPLWLAPTLEQKSKVLSAYRTGRAPIGSAQGTIPYLYPPHMLGCPTARSERTKNRINFFRKSPQFLFFVSE